MVLSPYCQAQVGGMECGVPTRAFGVQCDKHSAKPIEIKASHRYLANSTVEEIEVSGHRIHFGGRDDDGYCYSHQSFACLIDLTEAERAAIRAL